MTTIPQNVVVPPSCPVCASAMKIRRRRNDGSEFWGCVNYPSCFGTRDAQNGLSGRLGQALPYQRLARLVKAAIQASDDECLSFRESQLQNVDDFELHLEVIEDAGEEAGYLLTLRKR